MEQKIANEPVSWREMLPKEDVEGFFLSLLFILDSVEEEWLWKMGSAY